MKEMLLRIVGRVTQILRKYYELLKKILHI